MPAPKERDLEQTRRQLGDWLATKLPDATGIFVGELAGPSTSGFSSDTLLFDAHWTEHGVPVERGLVARLKPGGMTVFPEYDVAKQFRIQQALAATDVPVVPMHWLEEDEACLGAPFYVMGRVDGRIPSDNPPYHQGGWLIETTPAEREALWWHGIDALAAIHTLDWRAAGLDFLERPGTTPQEAQLREYEDMHRWMGGRPKKLIERGLAWARENAPRDDEPVVISWGDSRIGNMIFDDDMNCRGVLDWEMAALGSPELDLAWWIFIDRHHSEGIGVERLAGFPGRDATLARYEKLTGYTVRNLEYYETFAALRFTVIMARLGQQLLHYGVLPEDSDFEIDNTCSRMLAAMLEA